MKRFENSAENPFSVIFGKEPFNPIFRTLQESEIINTFTSSNPAYQACMIHGVRGSGKTVALTSISKQIENLKDWIVLDLNPERDLLKQCSAALCNRTDLLKIFKEAKINLSFFGVSMEFSGNVPTKTKKLLIP